MVAREVRARVAAIRAELAFCWKSGWSLSDTLVDTDKLASEPPPKKVLDALAACEY